MEENMAGNARTGPGLNFKHSSQEVLSEKVACDQRPKRHVVIQGEENCRQREEQV